MNALGISLLWCVVQATLFTSLGLMVYVALRRRGPAAAATAVASTLVVLAVVSALAFSPWPRWYTFGAVAPGLAPGGSNVNLRAGGQTSATAAAATDAETNPPAIGRGANASADTRLSDAWQFFWDELRRTPVAGGEPTAGWRWPGIVAGLFLLGVCLAIGRVALGLLAVRRYRARMTAISDPALLAQAASIARRMQCRRPVELRQSASLNTPATIGWRRPVVILPDDWRSWDETERQVVLAHEIAHIARGDYAAWLIAQLSVALHFYHPLVHWLARRLRLEQELAADAWAAALAGSRETYLMTLAQMALRQDDRAIAWAARGFLPTRGAFLRRIEMLRENKPLRSASLSRPRAAVLMALVAVVGLAIAGVRGPGDHSQIAQAAPPAKDAIVAKPPAGDSHKTAFDLSYVPSRAVAVIAVRPAQILARPGMEALAKVLNEGALQPAGVKAEKIEQIKLVITRLKAGLGGDSAAVIRYQEPIDWKAQFGPTIITRPVEATIAGKTYYHSDQGEAATRPAFYLPDDRTIVVGPEIDVQRAIVESGKRQPDWSQRWQQLATGQAAVMVDLEAVGRAAGDEAKRQPAAAFAPIWEQGQRLFVSAELADQMDVTAKIDCGNDEGAKRVQETMQAALTLARNALDEADRKLAGGPAAQAAALLPLLDMAGEALKQGKLQVEGSTVQFTTQLDFDAAGSAAVLLAPAVMAARESARRAQSTNNMKQIMIALYNYHDVNGHFPPPVVIGPDGKTPHSWRVEILPFLSQEPLYRQYRMDEPWDSENNKKVLAQAPVQLRDANAGPKSTDTCYFALVGPDTMLGQRGDQGMKLQDILDGTSNTIAIVEAKRAVPWTKPEDIEVDAAKPLPKVGGLHPGGFLAGFGDGSVRFLGDNLNQQTLRALISRAGGEQIPNIPAP